MDNILPLHTHCPETGALVFHKSAFQVEQEASAEKLALVQSENASMKALMAAMIDAMSDTAKKKLPPELVALVQPSEG